MVSSFHRSNFSGGSLSGLHLGLLIARSPASAATWNLGSLPNLTLSSTLGSPRSEPSRLSHILIRTRSDPASCAPAGKFQHARICRRTASISERVIGRLRAAVLTPACVRAAVRSRSDCSDSFNLPTVLKTESSASFLAGFLAGGFFTVFFGGFPLFLGRSFAGGRDRGSAATWRSIFGAASFADSCGLGSGFFFGFATACTGFSGFFGAVLSFSGFGAGLAARFSGFLSGFFTGFAIGLGLVLGVDLSAGGSGLFADARFFGFSACRCKARGSTSTRFGAAVFGVGAGSALFAGFGGEGGATFSIVAGFATGFAAGFAAGFATVVCFGGAGFGFGSATFGGAGGFGLTGSGSGGGFAACRSRATGFLAVSRSASGLRSDFGFGFSPLLSCVMSARRTISTAMLSDAFAGGFASQGSPTATATTTSVCRTTENRMPRMAARPPPSRCRLRRPARPSGSRRSKSNSSPA